MFRRHHRQFFPLPNEGDHSGSGIAEDTSYGLLRFETREAIGIGQPTLFSHARFISHLSKNRQAEKRLPERAGSAPMLKTYPLGREMTLKTFVVDYLVPMSNEESHHAVLAAHVYLFNKDEDIKNQVLSAFWAHNKDVPKAVQGKVSNTEQWLRYLKLTVNIE